jgi:hypothetical protein
LFYIDLLSTDSTFSAVISLKPFHQTGNKGHIPFYSEDHTLFTILMTMFNMESTKPVWWNGFKLITAENVESVESACHFFAYGLKSCQRVRIDVVGLYC